MPLSISVAAEMIFIVEPGASLPRNAALNSSARLLATASTSPVLGFTATTDDSEYSLTAFSAAACAPALSVVVSLPGLALRERDAASCRPLPRPAPDRQFDARRAARTCRRTAPAVVQDRPEGGVLLLRQHVAVPVHRLDRRVRRLARDQGVPGSVRSGCSTVGCQSTSARPVVSPRTTVSSLLYDEGLALPLVRHRGRTENGTVPPDGRTRRDLHVGQVRLGAVVGEQWLAPHPRCS